MKYLSPFFAVFMVIVLALVVFFLLARAFTNAYSMAVIG